MLRVAFRVSNENNSGRGHLSRCIAIRKYFSEHAIWFLDKPIKDLNIKFKKNDKFIIEESIESIDNLEKFVLEKKISFIIVDSYNINIKKLESLSRLVQIISICDFFPYPKVDLIVNPQPNALKGKNVLPGPLYAPILYSNSDRYVDKKKILVKGNIKVLRKKKIYL